MFAIIYFESEGGQPHVICNPSFSTRESAEIKIEKLKKLFSDYKYLVAPIRQSAFEVANG